jgi:hypothetical protein
MPAFVCCNPELGGLPSSLLVLREVFCWREIRVSIEDRCQDVLVRHRDYVTNSVRELAHIVLRPLRFDSRDELKKLITEPAHKVCDLSRGRAVVNTDAFVVPRRFTLCWRSGFCVDDMPNGDRVSRMQLDLTPINRFGFMRCGIAKCSNPQACWSLAARILHKMNADASGSVEPRDDLRLAIDAHYERHAIPPSCADRLTELALSCRPRRDDAGCGPSDRSRHCTNGRANGRQRQDDHCAACQLQRLVGPSLFATLTPTHSNIGHQFFSTVNVRREPIFGLTAEFK